MKIAFISTWYSEGMGYSENMFPKALARLGAEVHLITSTAQIYCYNANYDQVYKPYLGPKFVEPVVKSIDGYTLHRLEHYDTRNIYMGPGIKGLYECLERLNPDIVQTFEILLDSTAVAADYVKDHTSLLFTECHTHASVFRQNNRKTWKEYAKKLVNRFNPKLSLINKMTTCCYPIAEDVAEIARSHFHVPPNKIRVQSLGVDTSSFIPPNEPWQQEIRNKIRASFGFTGSDIVCIYTGRFTKDKNPHCLAEAIALLNAGGLPFKGLFIGNGTEEDISFIQSKQGCRIGSFVPAKELPGFYWAADIGVWPREESTSQLDAAACGLPLVLSNQIKVTERIDGNGFLYEEGNAQNLAEVLKKLSDGNIRKKMSLAGIDKIEKRFSWTKIASDRLSDFRYFGESKQLTRQ